MAVRDLNNKVWPEEGGKNLSVSLISSDQIENVKRNCSNPVKDDNYEEFKRQEDLKNMKYHM